MDISNNIGRMALGIIIIGGMILLGMPMAVQADSPSNADEYFDEFRSLDGTASFQEYEEIGGVQTFATTRIQEVGTLSASERQEMNSLLGTMEEFDSAYQEYQSGNYAASIEAADRASAHINNLREFNADQASLAELGLNRLYEDIAQDARSEAEQTGNSPEQIELLQLTADAYEGGGNTEEAAQFKIEAENLQAELNSAEEQIEQAENEANEYINSCQDCDSVVGVISNKITPVAIFSEYQNSQQAVSDIQVAQEAVSTHGLEAQGETVEAVSGEIRSIWLSLLITSSIIVLGYGLIVAGISTILFDRIIAWRNAFAESRVDSVVQMGGNNV